jgi:hypothetical protein
MSVSLTGANNRSGNSYLHSHLSPGMHNIQTYIRPFYKCNKPASRPPFPAAIVVVGLYLHSRFFPHLRIVNGYMVYGVSSCLTILSVPFVDVVVPHIIYQTCEARQRSQSQHLVKEVPDVSVCVGWFLYAPGFCCPVDFPPRICSRRFRRYFVVGQGEWESTS